MMQRLLAADQRYSQNLRYAEEPGPLRRLAIFLAHSGDSWFWGLGLVAVWLMGGPEAKALAVRMVVGIGLLAIVVLAIKRLVRRQRPAGDWGALYRKTDPHSFPSGHAARMTMLLVLAAGFGPAWLAWLLLAWAPLVSLARVAMGVHYLSDILVGGLLGLLAGWLMLLVMRLMM